MGLRLCPDRFGPVGVLLRLAMVGIMARNFSCHAGGNFRERLMVAWAIMGVPHFQEYRYFPREIAIVCKLLQ
jgi:hypothetical protein